MSLVHHCAILYLFSHLAFFFPLALSLFAFHYLIFTFAIRINEIVSNFAVTPWFHMHCPNYIVNFDNEASIRASIYLLWDNCQLWLSYCDEIIELGTKMELPLAVKEFTLVDYLWLKLILDTVYDSILKKLCSDGCFNCHFLYNQIYFTDDIFFLLCPFSF